jgi:hypothetical protein
MQKPNNNKKKQYKNNRFLKKFKNLIMYQIGLFIPRQRGVVVRSDSSIIFPTRHGCRGIVATNQGRGKIIQSEKIRRTYNTKLFISGFEIRCNGLYSSQEQIIHYYQIHILLQFECEFYNMIKSPKVKLN